LRADSRVLSLDLALAWRERERGANHVVVFTNGVFDLVHAGHVAYLEHARALGDALIVGINSDASARRLKGRRRPFVAFDDRARVVAGLRCVDAVVGFDELTPETLLDCLRPEIHVKSAQYRLEDLPERLVVEGYGGKIVLAPHVAGKSTTDLAVRILERSASCEEA
jgi:rfaE bifunctional protein nucleotidyltransferase chain/domain